MVLPGISSTLTTLANETLLYFRDLIYAACGVSISEDKGKVFIALRLQRRLTELGLPSFEEYRDYIEKDVSGAEVEKIINSSFPPQSVLV